MARVWVAGSLMVGIEVARIRVAQRISARVAIASTPIALTQTSHYQALSHAFPTPFARLLHWGCVGLVNQAEVQGSSRTILLNPRMALKSNAQCGGINTTGLKKTPPP